MTSKAVLLDTGVIVALFDRSEKKHKQCVEAVTNLNRSLITCEAVIAEACYLLREIPGASSAILSNIGNGVFKIPFSLIGQEEKVAKLMKKYADVPMDFADACLVAMAEQFKVTEILTLDSDFTIYRFANSKHFCLLV